MNHHSMRARNNLAADFGQPNRRDEMESLDIWRLCDELNVIQAALLIAGCDPSADGAYVEGWPPEKRPRGYEAAKTAISIGLSTEAIAGKVVQHAPDNFEDHVPAFDVDPGRSIVSVPSLKKWLRSRGIKIGFFFPGETEFRDYLDPDHDRYAPKLAAAVRAWEATADPALLAGKSPKQGLMKWLREHAADFELTDDEGNPNEQGIEDIAKVANWKLTGGAPKTPGG